MGVSRIRSRTAKVKSTSKLAESLQQAWAAGLKRADSRDKRQQIAHSEKQQPAKKKVTSKTRLQGPWEKQVEATWASIRRPRLKETSSGHHEVASHPVKHVAKEEMQRPQAVHSH